MMRINVGRADAVIRGGLAVVCLLLAVLLNQETVVSLGAALCAILLAATALTRHCPLYDLFGRSTGSQPSRPQQH